MRLFVALDIPEAARTALAEMTRRFQEICPAARWVRLESAHVTLKFIGEVPQEQGEPIRELLTSVQAGGPLDLRFAGLGFFPGTHQPRVLWAGVRSQPAVPSTKGKAMSSLDRLAAEIDAALVPAGIATEKREFNPHITLARFSNDARRLDSLRAAVGEVANSEFCSARVSEFHLYRSMLRSTGAEYTHLDSYPLRGERAR